MPTKLSDKVNSVVSQVPDLQGARGFVQHVDRRGEGVWRATSDRGDFAIKFRRSAAQHLLKTEFERMSQAWRAGVAAEPVAYNEAEGWIVSRWLDGDPISPIEPPSDSSLQHVANVCARLHSSDPFGGLPADPGAALELYLTRLGGQYGVMPSGYKTWRDRALELAVNLTATAESAPCHNDLFPANLICGADGCNLIDWEYAADNDPAFDLATFAVCMSLGVRNSDRLVASYRDAAMELRGHLPENSLPTLPRVHGWMLVAAVTWLPWAITDDAMPPPSKAVWTDWARLRYENVTAEISDRDFEQMLEAACVSV